MKAHFHKFGYDAMEGRGEEGNVMWSVAIIECEDGKILQADPDHIQFTDGLNPVKFDNSEEVPFT